MAMRQTNAKTSQSIKVNILFKMLEKKTNNSE